jgi:hypothetical protein
MEEGRELWRKYCDGFFEKSFQEQLKHNEGLMRRYFDKWKNTKLAKVLCKKKPRSMDDVPPTDYTNYHMLHEFGRKVEEREKNVPRKKGELFYDYYMRIVGDLTPIVRDYMVEAPYFWAKTTGTTGHSKWCVYGETFWRNYVKASFTSILMATSDSWGEPKIKRGAKALNLIAPIPYLTGWGTRASRELFTLIPPIEITDNEPSMHRRMYITLKLIEKGNKIEVAGGSGSLLYMIAKYFTEPEYFFSESARVSSGMKKFLITLKLLELKLRPRRRRKITDLMPLKGVSVSSTDARLYAKFLKEEFGLEPLNSYGTTEIGIVMGGRPDRRLDFYPDLRVSYFEFLDDSGEMYKIDELKKDEVYELIATAFGSIFFRYKTGDLFRVIDFCDDGMPIFNFEGRKTTVLDFYGYFRVTEDIMTRALVKAGFELSDRWSVAKVIRPQERLHIMMEKEWEIDEEAAGTLIFNALLDVCPEFRNYVKDFKVKDPDQIIKVEYLERGTFTRYVLLQSKKGAPIGQLKPPKMIPPDKHEIVENLKACSRT